MRPIKNYDEVEAAGAFEKLPAGGYVIKITAVNDEPAKEYLKLTYDIAEGPEAGRYKDEENEWRHSFIRSYKETALSMFKAFTVAVDRSNGTSFTEQIKTGWNEQTLVGKILGVVIGYEEYEANDGSVKEKTRIATCLSAEKVRNGEFKIPELKKLASAGGAPVEGFTPLGDEALPF